MTLILREGGLNDFVEDVNPDGTLVTTTDLQSAKQYPNITAVIRDFRNSDRVLIADQNSIRAIRVRSQQIAEDVEIGG